MLITKNSKYLVKQGMPSPLIFTILVSKAPLRQVSKHRLKLLEGLFIFIEYMGIHALSS